MKYEVSDLELVWKKGDGEMPKELQHVVNAAREKLFLSSLNLSVDDENTIRYNADKNSQTVTEYISALVTNNLHPA